MFRRELYRTMARELEALDADVLARTSFRFGGGTYLALAHGEYRLSRDLDFVCSDPGGYAELRRRNDRVRARGARMHRASMGGRRGADGIAGAAVRAGSYAMGSGSFFFLALATRARSAARRSSSAASSYGDSRRSRRSACVSSLSSSYSACACTTSAP
ncbi:hypothetical protein NQZ70_05409 [Sorangium sp. Soce836]|nr:hypothetical protein NQZ70_05409 [Sorangium sp. Soce836]